MSEEALTMELTKTIARAAIDGTLSENAVKQFTGVMEENGKLRTALKEKQEDFRQADQERVDLRNALKVEQEACTKLKDRESELALRESAAEVLAMTVKYEQKRVEDHKEMVSLVFRNTLLRKQVMSRHDSHTESNGACHNSYENKDELEEKEE